MERNADGYTGGSSGGAGAAGSTGGYGNSGDISGSAGYGAGASGSSAGTGGSSYGGSSGSETSGGLADRARDIAGNAKDKLADALESGAFKQGRGLLRYANDYCCLGVACELYRQTTGKGNWHPDGRFECGLKSSSAFTAPPEVDAWYGWTASGRPFGDPIIEIQRISRRAAFFNDRGANFFEIADGFRWLSQQETSPNAA